MQTFAVTPEVLDQGIDKVMDAIKEQGKDQNKSMTSLEHKMLGHAITLIGLGLTALGMMGRLLSQLP